MMERRRELGRSISDSRREKSYSSGERKDGPKDQSGNRPVSAGQHPAYGEELLQHNETSVFGRLGENHGGVERPMDPVSCRTPDEFPQDHFLCFRGSRGQIRKDHMKRIVLRGRFKAGICLPLHNERVK